MRAISLLQPWASLIALGGKSIETRGWSTLYKGRLAIHASQRFPRECRELCDDDAFAAVIDPTGTLDPTRRGAHLPRGAVIATARMVGCIRTERFRERADYERERPFGNYADGRWAWLLVDVVPFWVPVPAKGALSLWEWSPP